jgi:2',3'-cyclic-nucleotide 2'-phosphodiesterase (5'-nucleotidase family)
MHFFARVKIISTLVFYLDFMRKLSLFLVVLAACSSQYQPKSVQFKDYKITNTTAVDSNYVKMLKPYGDSVRVLMSETVGRLDQTLNKENNGGPLGCFMSDAFLTMARLKFNESIDVAFMNAGGVRLTQLPAGKITRGTIFELMPFDNALILVKIKGDTLQSFLNLVAARGGWPVSGMTMQIKNKKAVNVVIGGKPLDPASTYTITLSDFIANGGDNAYILKDLPRVNKNYLVRDALIEYVSSFEKQGKSVLINNEIRVTNAQ